MNSRQDYENPPFTHIYVEKRVQTHPRTREILTHFPNAQIVAIDHYKDVFNRRGQDAPLQHRFQSLILARKEDHFFYEGAPVCQDFGNTNFYYCSTMMNCLFDCSYCYLKGMYPSGHMVIFMNLEDYFSELDAFLAHKSMYLCVSYDADLLAMEPLAGYAKLWSDYATLHENLKLEIRTKSARLAMWEELPCLSNVIYAFTLSPQKMIDACERGTPSAKARIACALAGLEKEFPVRLCFDPMLYLPTWREDYGELLSELDAAFAGHDLTMQKLTDVSVGTFRISQDYLKKMRKDMPRSAVVNFPYDNVNGYYQYPENIRSDMEEFMIQAVSEYVDKDRIFMWK